MTSSASVENGFISRTLEPKSEMRWTDWAWQPKKLPHSVMSMRYSLFSIVDNGGNSMINTGERIPFSSTEVHPMRRTRNVGLLLLGIWLIVTGLLPFVSLPIPSLSTILSLLAIAAGVFILMNR
jgi:hypothetical protein